MKILVIEDSTFFRKSIQAALTGAGYETLGAASGEEGLKIVRDAPPDVIVLDMLMPRLDGMMVLRILRSNPATRTTPVIVMSGNTRPEDIAAAEALKIVAYLNKEHMKADELLAHIRQVEASIQ